MAVGSRVRRILLLCGSALVLQGLEDGSPTDIFPDAAHVVIHPRHLAHCLDKLVARVGNAVALSGLHEQFGRHAESLQRHVQLHGLRARHPRVPLDHMDHCRRFRGFDVFQRRLVPVGVEIVVRKPVAQIVLNNKQLLLRGCVRMTRIGREGPGFRREAAETSGKGP